MAIEEAQLIKETISSSRPATPIGPVRHRRRAGAGAQGGVALMAETRSPEEIRRSIEANRAELGLAVERLRVEVAQATDWRGHFNRNRKQILIGVAVAGFVVGGGIAALTGLVTGRRSSDY